MTDVPLLDLIELDRKWRLEDWWAGFLADCAARKQRRDEKLSAAAHKGAHTRWINEHANLRRANIRARNPFGGMGGESR